MIALGELSPAALARRLAAGDVVLHAGPFLLRVACDAPLFARHLALMYPHHPLSTAAEAPVCDFSVRMETDRGWRRWYRPRIRFRAEGPDPLAPFPRDHALPLFEWGINFHIGFFANRWLLLHAAVLARDDRALILPGYPGSGKSTLAAALMMRGWRLFSDEFGVVDPRSGLLYPLARPVALKNASIPALTHFAPAAPLGPPFPRTRKGTVAHLPPDAASVAAMHRPARPAWVVAPAFAAGQTLRWQEVRERERFLLLAGHAFNYEVHGAEGFAVVADLMTRCRFARLNHGDLASAVTAVEDFTHDG
ncbi:MAG: HprK-related kinase A [Magnetococcus sp. WYHC-3]